MLETFKEPQNAQLVLLLASIKPINIKKKWRRQCEKGAKSREERLTYCSIAIVGDGQIVHLF